MRLDIQPYISAATNPSASESLFIKYKISEENKVTIEENYINIDKNAEINFDTYFNSFSTCKWKKYTKIDNLKLEITFKGRFKILIHNHYLKANTLTRSTILTEFLNSDVKTSTVLNLALVDNGNMHIELIALEDESKFYDFCYFTDIEEKDINDIKLALNICTFKREMYVERNLEFLKKEYLLNENSPLYNGLYVYVTDNGQTLDIERLTDRHIIINKNKNTGGAGGFTRGLIEIHNSDNGITNVVMMDDDVVIPHSAVYRLYMFLCVVKEEYKECNIGGSMLRADSTYIQHELGATYSDGNVSAGKHNYNLLDGYFIVRNEIEEGANYYSWWFYCFNIKRIQEDKLPLPIFIKIDDVEYSLRSRYKTITLNGIGVWHEPFEDKVTSHLEYFHNRNKYIVTALRNQSIFTYYKTMIKILGKNTLLYKYNYNKNLLNGLEDYLKGPEYLMTKDTFEILKEQLAFNYKIEDLENLSVSFNIPDLDVSVDRQASKSNKIKRALTFNGYLLPEKGVSIVVDNYAHKSFRPINFYRKSKVLLVNNEFTKGYVLERSRKEVFSMLLRLAGLSIKLALNNKKLKKSYQDVYGVITSEEYWRKYLDLDKQQ